MKRYKISGTILAAALLLSACAPAAKESAVRWSENQVPISGVAHLGPTAGIF